MPDTTAKILAKGTNATGITEQLAEQLHDQLGKKLMAIIEITSDSRTENAEGQQKVNLKVLTLEPAPDADTETHLRELARAFHYERKLVDSDGQLQIETREDLEPKVSDVIAAQQQHMAHEFLPDFGAPKECEVCGKGARAKVHQDVPPADDTPADPSVDPEPDTDEPDPATA